MRGFLVEIGKLFFIQKGQGFRIKKKTFLLKNK